MNPITRLGHAWTALVLAGSTLTACAHNAPSNTKVEASATAATPPAVPVTTLAKPAVGPAKAAAAPGAQEYNAMAKQYSKPSDDVIRQKLSPLAYQVTQKEGTEPPFANEYWNNHAAGIYVDSVSGEPLFSSMDKFDSGTGWPSFTRPIAKGGIVEHTDSTLGMSRTEVRSKNADSHLGHVFDDGPGPTGMRYCINSASLRFVPVDRLETEGYGEYLSLFGKQTASK